MTIKNFTETYHVRLMDSSLTAATATETTFTVGNKYAIKIKRHICRDFNSDNLKMPRMSTLLVVSDVKSSNISIDKV